ncbi:TPA: hypothetical protein ACSP3W_003734 [Aeromonas veronii]|uniref:hypothetical protein n=1 Tax=Aeromonas veronii TaxID=654 RepID=UPI00214DA891|nr:hypothetical protein [Aeromonas veronii]MCR3973649.1 hypothetical protein [Aeromonas veronii]MCR3977858.1 hypothetical protein [Aeromonas veronii]
MPESECNIPKTWTEIKKLKRDLYAEAKDQALSDSEYPVIRSRGGILAVADANEKVLIPTGECLYLPPNQTLYMRLLRSIKEVHPTAARVWLVVGVDSAASVRDLNDGDYQPWSGEAEAIVHLYSE